MTALLRWVRFRFRRTRIYQGTEPYGPFIPWQEVLRRSTAEVPNPKGRPHE